MADAAPAQGLSKTPADFLKSIKGKPVIVKLNSGVDYRGELTGRAAPCRCCGASPRRRSASASACGAQHAPVEAEQPLTLARAPSLLC
jgi:hypothetical protein